MQRLSGMVRQLIRLREKASIEVTLLAVCPNSSAVLEAAVLAASRSHAPMLFAATLNQVDRDGGYTGWTPHTFVQAMQRYAHRHRWEGPLYPCLDHGGPWLKDTHRTNQLSLEDTMREVKASLTASLKSGYRLLHIDPTVDPASPAGAPVSIDIVVERTIELMEHTESERERLGLPPVDYEVGTEEVHGGLVDFGSFEHFIARLREELVTRDLMHA